MAAEPTGVIRTQGFGTTEVERRAETAATSAAATARAVIESQYIMAMRNPRDWDNVRVRVLRECDRPGFAREAIYHKPIGDGVSGLSVRFAEVAVRCMGNLAIPTVTTFDDDQKRIVNQSVIDLESNVHYSRDVTINKTVERQKVRDGQQVIAQRMNSRGQMVYIVAASDDDLLNKEGAMVSKALRTLVLRLLPGDIQADARRRITETQQKEIASDPEGQKKAILDAFYQRGVKPAQVKEFLGHDMDALSVDEVATLRALHNAIRDGEANMRDAIEHAREQRGEKPAATTAADDAPPPETVTQRVSARAADVLQKVRESEPAEAEKVRGRPPLCHVCKAGALRSVFERETKKCDACRQSENAAMQLKPEASVADEPAEVEDPVTSLAQRVRFKLMVNCGGILSKAEVELSEMFGGKVQTFEALPEYLRANPAFIEKVMGAMQ